VSARRSGSFPSESFASPALSPLLLPLPRRRLAESLLKVGIVALAKDGDGGARLLALPFEGAALKALQGVSSSSSLPCPLICSANPLPALLCCSSGAACIAAALLGMRAYSPLGSSTKGSKLRHSRPKRAAGIDAGHAALSNLANSDMDAATSMPCGLSCGLLNK
jgi:hypothetical protein